MVDTWKRRSQFVYNGNVNIGTEIIYGNNRRISVSTQQYQTLINHFHGQIVEVSPSRTDPAAGSLEQWLHQNITRTAIANYVAPILVEEHIATRTPNNRLQF